MLPDISWTTGVAPGGLDEGLHQAVARRARTSPDATALILEERQVSYEELDATADGWAALMNAAGVKAGDYVPIMLPRGIELVTALLAVLKVGAAYALLDPGWPPLRVQEILDELQPPLLVIAQGNYSLPLWKPPRGPLPQPAEFQAAKVAGSDPCCVFFTSGTTGRPKGVVSTHQATARLFPAQGFARFTGDTVMPLAAATPWDAFSLELWSMLLSGGTALVVTEPFLTAAGLRAAVARHGVDTVWLTSSLFDLVVDEDVAAFSGLRQLITGGERLSRGHVARFLDSHPTIALLNGYGPVEATIFTTTHRITRADCDLPDGIPLGRAVPGTEVRVLDQGRTCVVGETGEICVAGQGLALGYLGDQELTATKFRREFLDGQAVRVFHTGDLGWWDEEGRLRYAGRADRQVKLRGHRVEPAEVERKIEQMLPAIQHCRVIARRDDRGAVCDLIAFGIPRQAGDDLAWAPAALRPTLPRFQQPAAVIAVQSFPVTATGKLDEPALLARLPAALSPAAPSPLSPDPVPSSAASPFPVSPAVIASLIASTFSAVLDRPVRHVEVPFVELGGSSLDIGRVAARLSAELGCPIPLTAMYQHPTAAALAEWLAAEAGIAEQNPPDRDAELPLTPMQLVYLLRHASSPGDRTAHCLLTWLVDGVLDTNALERAVAAVHERHECLRMAYVFDPSPAAIAVEVPPPLPLRLAAVADAEDALAAARNALRAELEPLTGELWRTVLVPVVGGQQSVFGCVVHHIAFDGWSESVLAADLASAYRGQQLAAPASTAVQWRTPGPHRQDDDPSGHVHGLATSLRGIPEVRWPGPPPLASATEPRQLSVTLDTATVAHVDALARVAAVSRFSVLLSIFARCLTQITGQSDLAVGIPVAQRADDCLSTAIGCHIAMLPVRLGGSLVTAGIGGARAAQEVMSRALAAADVPFAELLRLVDPPPTRRPPLYQVLFALQDNAPASLKLPGLRTVFVRQPYLELPLELHAELWPAPDEQLQLVVSWRPDAVPERCALALAELFSELASARSWLSC